MDGFVSNAVLFCCIKRGECESEAVDFLSVYNNTLACAHKLCMSENASDGNELPPECG